MNQAAKMGNICAGISVAFILLIHYSGLSVFFVKGLGSGFSSLVEVLFIFLAIYMTRQKEFGGFIEFRLAARAGLTMVIINAILFAFFQYVYYSFIEKDFVNRFLPDYEKWSVVMGTSKADIEKYKTLLGTTFSPINAAWSSFSSMLFCETLLALLFARILRRVPPEVPRDS